MRNFKKYVFLLIWLTLVNLTGVDSAISGGKVGKNLAQNLTSAAVDAGSAQVAHGIGSAHATGSLSSEHPVDRSMFNQERSKYWMDRAQEVIDGQK